MLCFRTFFAESSTWVAGVLPLGAKASSTGAKALLTVASVPFISVKERSTVAKVCFVCAKGSFIGAEALPIGAEVRTQTAKVRTNGEDVQTRRASKLISF